MRAIVLAVACVALLTARVDAQGMLDSKHNLSVVGPGPIKAQTETQVCVFCHTPHNTAPVAPLWNRELSGQTYTPYASNTLQAVVGQPNGYSRLCLSCHDGSLAIGNVMNLGGQSRTISMDGTAANGAMPTSSSALIGTNLTNDHPISFAFSAAVYSNDQELVNPATLSAQIRLYEGATAGVRDSVQCTTCHDPHLIVNAYFLKKSFSGRLDNLCLTCHVKPGWSGSSHESAITKFFGGTAVSELSCGACHRPHTDLGAPRLLRGATGGTGAAIEQTCYRCHNSSGITFNLQAEFAKKLAGTGSIHPIASLPGAHEPVFTVATPPEPALNNVSKHVECTDCHNPHRVRARETAGTGGVLEGMRGIKLDGTVRNDATLTASDDLVQYEICLRCHGDSRAIAVPDNVDGDLNGTRSAGAIPTSNKRTELQTTNSSYHPIAGAGKNTSSRLASQLLGGLTTSSTIKCTDCHNNDAYGTVQGPVPTGVSSLNQPKGPHGSTNFNLLRARVWNVPLGPSSWDSANFQLCFRCHSVSLLVTTQNCDVAGTNFCDDNTSGNGKDNLHKMHLETRATKARGVCKSCHYNVHSNAEAANTQYRILTGTAADCSTSNGTVYTDPENVPLTTTRLVNFHPGITAIGGRSKPEWCFNKQTRKRECFLQCHTADGRMEGENRGHRYTPHVTGDIQ